MGRYVGRWVDRGTSLLALALVLGCEAQASDEYGGEPLLSLQGTVLLTKDQVNSNLVPRLAFRAAESVVLVDGEVTGEFPAKFRFEVIQPPPREAFFETSDGTKVASGFLVMVPPDFPKRIPSYFIPENLEQTCSEDGTRCTNTFRECDADNRCRETVEECVERPCELVEHLGDTPLDPETTGDWGHLFCDGRTCGTASSSSDASGNWVIDFYHCDPGPGEHSPNSTVSTGGTMELCSVLSQSGDTSLLSFADLQTVAVEYAVFYTAHDDPATGLARGYHLFRQPTREQWEAQLKCEVDAEAKALAQYNEDNGTNHSPYDTEVEEVRENAAEVECAHLDGGSIEQPLDQDLTIELGNPQDF